MNDEQVGKHPGQAAPAEDTSRLYVRAQLAY